MAKLAMLAVSALALHALCSNEVSSVSMMINIDSQAVEDATRVFQDALDEEKPGIKASDQMSSQNRSVGIQLHVLDSNKMNKSKASPYADLLESSLPANDFVSHFEQDVTEMIIGLSKAGKKATPMAGSVAKLKDLVTKNLMPEVIAAHNADQKKLNYLADLAEACTTVKNKVLKDALVTHQLYKSFSPKHKTCRATEADLYSKTHDAWKDLKAKTRVKKDRCKAYSETSKKLGEQDKNKDIVAKGSSESVEAYVRRITSTICGKPGGKGNGGNGEGGFLDKLLDAKHACQLATKEFNKASALFKSLDKSWHDTKKKCDNTQDAMDNVACKYAVKVKDACEVYTDCHITKKAAYLKFELEVKKDEKDRKAEWRGLKRMECLIDAFSDGKVIQAEIDKCKNSVHKTDHLNITYPGVKTMESCSPPDAYPYTAAYKKAEFSPLPALAKGKMDANPCLGIKNIDTRPLPGSPASCKCERVSLNGPYSAGAMVKCIGCIAIRKATDQTSCPAGTKLFSPRSSQDWETFLKSAAPLRAPNWIIDVTRPQNGCGGCTGNVMNSAVPQQKSWRTSDGSPWWLRSSRYNEPNGDYSANCYLDLWHNPPNADSVTWNDGNCNYHSKSYYCQLKSQSLNPKPGSPSGCKCAKVQLVGTYSPGALLKCTNCLRVYKSLQTNSCPPGTKLFSPKTRADWKAFLASATPLRDPHWIIDVTRPSNGCGGCTKHAMNSGNAAQATWKTKDGAPWWLRSSRYNEPNGDYSANCYLDLWQSPANENSVTWNDGRCSYNSKSYYCQPTKGSALSGPKYTSTAPPWKNALTTKPNTGSPSSCKCTLLTLKGDYSAKALMKCENCLDVKDKTQKNSCPQGTKLFAPATREDWKTFFESGLDTLKAPNWIADITRPQNGCGGCEWEAMNSGNSFQASWKTSDGEPWWLTDYGGLGEPNGDYHANCFLNVWHGGGVDPWDHVFFNDNNCNYHSKSYYCQPKGR